MKARDLVNASAGLQALRGNGEIEIDPVSGLALLRQGALAFLKAEA